MSTPNPIVSRLQQQKSRISSMLSPGRKHVRMGAAAPEFSPVASDFAGRKFLLAAQKMRVLDSRRMGLQKPELRNSLAGEIEDRFANVSDLLHLTPRQAGEKSIWSDVNLVFPGGPMAERSHAPEEPGTMRQGSIIQKFSVLPKPGQSLESFKEQAQRLPSTRKTTRDVPKPARLDPKDRLFSRVQEITPASLEQKARSGQGDGSDSASSQPTPADSIQRKIDPDSQARSAPAIEKPVQVIPTETAPAARPVPDAPAKEPELKQSKQEQPQVDAPAKTDVTPAQPQSLRAVPAAGKDLPAGEPQKSKAETKLLLALPVPTDREKERIDRAVALPVVKKKSPAAGLQRLPHAKPAAAASQQMNRSRPANPLPPSQPASQAAQTIQRESEPALPDAISRSEFKKDAPGESEITGVYQTIPRDTDNTRLEATGLIGSEKPSMQDQPLRKVILYRQNATEAVKSLKKPADLGMHQSKPLVNIPLQPILSVGKYRSGANPPVPASTPTFAPRPSDQFTPPILPPSANKPISVGKMSVDSLEGTYQTSFQPGRFDAAVQNVNTQAEPVKMELAKTASTIRLSSSPNLQFSSTTSGIGLPEIAKMEPPKTQANQAMPLVGTAASPVTASSPAGAAGKAGSQNVVQRLWEEHSSPGPKQGGGSQNGQQSASGEGEMTQLAESILPYVKRLLEIEAERSGSRFR